MNRSGQPSGDKSSGDKSSGKELSSGDERIADWCDDRLPPRELSRFEAELRVNVRLRTEAEAYRRMVGEVRASLTGGDEPVDLTGRVLVAIQQGAAKKSPIRSQHWSRPAVLSSAMVAAAAWLLLALLGRLQPNDGASDGGKQLAQAKSKMAASSAANGAEKAIARAAPLKDSAPLLLPDGFRDRRGAVPLVQSSVIPQVTLLRPAVAQSADHAKNSDRGKAVQVPFDPARIAGPLRVQALAGVPITVGEADKGYALGSAAESGMAWLLEGTQAELEAFLAQLGELARERGFECRNDEAEPASVAVMESLPELIEQGGKLVEQGSKLVEQGGKQRDSKDDKAQTLPPGGGSGTAAQALPRGSASAGEPRHRLVLVVRDQPPATGK
ncbi:MAG: hypothetical protein NT107_05300 [Planctomycetota bacterium]|nr:hypothetical protein [Planctomycetota bacterium]